MTIYGFFERALVMLRDDEAADPELVRDVMSKMLALSWQTHEGTASYDELCMCDARGIDVEQHFDTFPEDYRAALDPIVEVLGMPEGVTAAYQWTAAIHLARVALSMPIVEELGSPETFTRERFEAFAAKHGPDRRFARLLDAIYARGGLAYLIPGYSAVLTQEWETRFPGQPAPRAEWRNREIFDLRAAAGRIEAVNLIDFAQEPLFRVILDAVPELPVVLGPEAGKAAMVSFVRAWSGRSKLIAEAPIVIGGPTDEFGPRDRSYEVRTRIDGKVPVRRLRQLRKFLGAQAKRGRTTFAGFNETTRGEVAVYAVATEGMETADVLTGSGEITFGDTWLGVLPRDELAALGALRSEPETYAPRTAWHVPMELFEKYDVGDIEPGLHGMVMRTIPAYDERLLRSAIAFAHRSGTTLKLRPFMNTEPPFQAIVLEVLLGGVQPAFLACLGSLPEARFFYSRLSDDDQRVVAWGGSADRSHANIIWMLLQLAYNFDVFAPQLFGMRVTR